MNSFTGAYWNAALQIFLFTIVMAFTIYAGPVAPLSILIAIGITITAAVFSLAVIRRTQEGEKTYHHWENYKNGLQNAKEYTIKSDQIDRHFVYGVAFGLQEKEIENLITSSADGTPAFGWFVYSGDTDSAAAVASSFSTLSATGTSSVSSAIGGAGASSSAAASAG